jgi:outer membrane protein TolC
MKIRAVLALVLLATPVAAQPKTPAKTDDMSAFDKELDALFDKSGLTADQVAARAVKASPTVRARRAQIDAAVAQAKTAELARVPHVGVSATYTRLSPIDPVSFGPGAPPLEFAQNSYVAEGQLNLALSDYLVRFPKLIAAAREGTEAARIGKRISEVDAAFEARTAYYEWVRAKLQTLVAQRQLTNIRATLGQVKALADAQRVSRADLMRVESQEAQVEQAADQLAQLSVLREQQLRIEIGAADNEALAIGEDIRADIAGPGVEPLDQAVVVAQKQRLDFQQYDVGIVAKEKEREAEAAGLFPRLSAFAVADYSRPNQRVFPQVDEFRFTWQAGLQLTWTLNDSLVTNANRDRIAGEIRELRANRENLEHGTRIAVLSSQQAVTIAQRALATSAKGLAAAEESYRVRQALLQAQRATGVELVDAETELTRARIAALDARIDLRIALVNLAHAIGADAR